MVRVYCEGLLKKDSRFWWMVDQLRLHEPGSERTKLVEEFWKSAYYMFHHSERDMIRIKGRILSDYIALLDEERLECERSSGPSRVEDGCGDALQVDQMNRSSPVQSRRFRARGGRSQR
jgi:hypothetical protein